MPSSKPLPPPLTKGLAFRLRSVPRPLRRAKLTFLGTLGAATVALIWPIYPLFGSARPLILGLPLSFAWVLLWLALVFIALVYLYRVQHRDDVQAPTESGADRGPSDG